MKWGLTILLLLCSAWPAWAAVGDVLSKSNALSSGCTRTFYIDYDGGSDANNGTATGTPWKRNPYMLAWAGSYTHQAGDCFIHKGGVTWPAAALTMKVTKGGSAGLYDYYGVDTTWYTGGSWTRPIFDAQGTAPSPANQMIHIACDSSGFAGYVTIDSIEIKGLLINVTSGAAASVLLSNCHDIMLNNLNIHDWSLGTSASANDANNWGGVGHGVSAGTSIANTVVQNSLIHNEEGCLRATVTMASRSSNVATLTLSTPVQANWYPGHSTTKISVSGISDTTFNNGEDIQRATWVDSTHLTYPNTGSDVASLSSSGSVKAACGVAIDYIQTSAYNEIYDLAHVILHGGYHVHDNSIHDIWGTYCDCGSTNLFYIGSWDGNTTPTHTDSYVYRNTVINANTGTAYYAISCDSSLYATTNMYFFNNVMIWKNSQQSNYPFQANPVHCGAGGVTTDGGLPNNSSVYVLNNTVRMTTADTAACGRVFSSSPTGKLKNFYFKNNHCINDESALTWSSTYLVNAVVSTTNLTTMTNAAATAAGYTEANNFAPDDGADVTVDTGTDLSSLCLGTLTALCSGIDAKHRPVGTAWDIGAYQWTDALPQPTTPTSLHTTQVTGTLASLIWAPPADADFASFRVYHSTVSGVYGAPIKTITAASAASAKSALTRYVAQLLTPGTYYFTVSSVNTGNVESEKATEVSVTVTGLTRSAATNRSAR